MKLDNMDMICFFSSSFYHNSNLRFPIFEFHDSFFQSNLVAVPGLGPALPPIMMSLGRCFYRQIGRPTDLIHGIHGICTVNWY